MGARKPPMMAGFQAEENLTGRASKKMCEKLWTLSLAQMGAHFPFQATIDDFDMSFQPSLDPGVIRELITLDWVTAGENVISIGPSGVGKTHLSIALGQIALESDFIL